MCKELITIEEFKEQVWKIEGVKISIDTNNYPDHLVRPYDFQRLSNNATVDDLKRRIDFCLNTPFIYFIKFNSKK